MPLKAQASSILDKKPQIQTLQFQADTQPIYAVTVKHAYIP